MKKHPRSPNTTRVRKPKKQDSHHRALILSPDEVEIHFQNFPEEERAGIRGRWMLAGAVNDELYLSLTANDGADIAAQVAVFPCPTGATYTVITCQLGGRQHRFVLPMYEPRVAELLSTAAKDELSVYLENKGRVKKGIVYDCPIRPSRFQDANSRCRAVDAGHKVDYIVEFPAVVSSMLAPETVPSLTGEIVSVVDASFFVPLLDLPAGSRCGY